MLRRICGHEQEFQHYESDKYRAQRQAKFQGTRCSDCVAALEREQLQAAPIPKGEALRLLPPGTRVTLAVGEDGSWSGTLDAGGGSVEFAGEAGAGPQSVIIALARLWLSSRAGADKPPA